MTDRAHEYSVELEALLTAAGVTKHKSLVRNIIESGVGMGQDNASRLNLKITSAAVAEMRRAFHLFAPYAETRKATVFGSARTQPGDPLYSAAEETARALAADDWMVVTGAGPGIMEAASVGAGSMMSLGVSIRLPFEEDPNPAVTSDENRVAMRYFFTRKLMLVKESSAFICLPGGFGTMDETFELLTLQQTGKMTPMPIVLLDRPGGTYWKHFARFIIDEIEGGGFATPGDLDRVLITDSVDAAVGHVREFWKNYCDLRWFDETLVLYVREAPSAQQLDELNDRFAPMVREGRIELVEPFPEEGSDRPELARLALNLVPRQVGELHRLIGALNELGS